MVGQFEEKLMNMIWNTRDLKAVKNPNILQQLFPYKDFTVNNI